MNTSDNVGDASLTSTSCSSFPKHVVVIYHTLFVLIIIDIINILLIGSLLFLLTGCLDLTGCVAISGP